MTVAQLRDEAEKEGIEGYSSMKKADLIDALKG
ncbi:Rho termination factor N-terminal domain-containing protein [Geomicrobium sp. JCM 19037]|nr:Rho termination factor N-terminal domain-containing protein [Geomicrobium sp. JCM 19037]